MKVENEINIYEVDGTEIAIGKSQQMKVKSHWVRNNFVILEIDGKSYTVTAADLERAIRNAGNWR